MPEMSSLASTITCVCWPSWISAGANWTDISCGGVVSEFGSFGCCCCCESLPCDEDDDPPDALCIEGGCVDGCCFGDGVAFAGAGVRAFAIGARTRESREGGEVAVGWVRVAGCRFLVVS